MDLIMQIRDSSLSGQGNEQKMLFSLYYHHHHFCAHACIATAAVQLVVSIPSLPREAKRLGLKMGLLG